MEVLCIVTTGGPAHVAWQWHHASRIHTPLHLHVASSSKNSCSLEPLKSIGSRWQSRVGNQEQQRSPPWFTTQHTAQQGRLYVTWREKKMENNPVKMNVNVTTSWIRDNSVTFAEFNLAFSIKQLGWAPAPRDPDRCQGENWWLEGCSVCSLCFMV